MLDIQEIISEYSYEQFVTDRKTQYAMIRAIEIIGEASKNVPLEIRENIVLSRGKTWLPCEID